MLKSKLCTQADFEMDWFRSACTNLREHWSYHRKVWEFCYIYHALLEREMLGPLRSGLGFGVGKEPLAAAFANHGCRILATDLDSSDTKATFWAGANQHASVLADLNERGICPPDQFTKLVQFSGMDMNKIPESCFGKFDFTWSSCSMDHLGSLAMSERFILNQMRCLKPSGVAAHTTEFNVLSNESTLESGEVVIFRQRDLESLARRLERRGHRVEFDFSAGQSEKDLQVDRPPYTGDPHLRVEIGGHVSTSIGLIITKGPENDSTVIDDDHAEIVLLQREVDRLQALVKGYERGRFMRLMRWLRRGNRS